MKLCDLLVGVPIIGGQYQNNTEITGISYDSRTVTEGALFVALSGTKKDGHRYMEEAWNRGAAAILCEENGTGQRIITTNSRVALATVSANWFGHPARGLTLIGVTGTNGKTTTTHLIKAALEGQMGAVVGLIGTNYNMIGDLELPANRTTPESYELQKILRRMANSGCNYVVMEVSSHALIQHRTAGLTFAVGVFTNLTQEHLDYHHTMEEYRRAKGLLFAQSNYAVLNMDDEAGRWYAEQVQCPVLTYSENKDSATLTAKNIRLFHSHVEFEAVAKRQIIRVYLPIPGGFSVYNGLTALGTCMALDISLKDSAPPLRVVRGVKGRVEVVSIPEAYTVIIDYAHTPDALENILITAREFTVGRLICLFGCGGDRERTKRPVMGAVAADLADLVILTSDNPRTENPQQILNQVQAGFSGFATPYHVEIDRKLAIHWALEQGALGDVIVLAGKGHETYQEVGTEQIPMDERDIIRDFFHIKQEKLVEKQAKCAGKSL